MHQEPGDIPALQGVLRVPMGGEPTPAARVASLVGGGALLVAGLRRPGPVRPALGVVGAGLMARSLAPNLIRGGRRG